MLMQSLKEALAIDMLIAVGSLSLFLATLASD